MKKSMFLAFILYAAVFIPVFGQEEYTLFCSGTDQGTVTIQRDRGGKITITGRLMPRYYSSGVVGSSSVDINHAVCPLIPVGEHVYFDSDTRSIIIDGNTTTRTNLDGSSSWNKVVVNGNTTTYTRSDGSWTKAVVNGNTTTGTRSNGYWTKTVVDGNTTTTTFPDGFWMKTVVNGNTTTTTLSTGGWTKKVVNGNTTTETSGLGGGTKTVVDKQGYNIFIETTDL